MSEDYLKSWKKNRPLSFEQTSNDSGYSFRKYDLELSDGYVPFFEKFLKRHGKARDAELLVIGSPTMEIVRAVADYFVNGTVRFISYDHKSHGSFKNQENFPQENIIKIGSYTKEGQFNIDTAVHDCDYGSINLVVDMTSNTKKIESFSKIFKQLKKGATYLMMNNNDSNLKNIIKNKSTSYKIEGTNDEIIVFKK